ncbi:MAG: hypothetical protein AAB550_01580 [Patescibacteria group bacterium]
MKLAIRILHYSKPNRPDRSNWVEAIKFILNDPRVSVFIDGSGTPYGGLKNLYNDFVKAKPTHILALHHDILPCFNFIPTVEKLIKMLPADPISFYSNGNAIETALHSHSHWVKARIWYYTQAYTMPFSVMQKMIAWIDENVIDDGRNSDDERIAMYFYYQNKYVYTTAPSLVEHIGWNSTTVDYDRPLEGYLDNRSHRMAKKFIGIDQDPLHLDWSKGLESPTINNEDWALEDSELLFQRLLKPTSKYKHAQ